jgi:hypothetical protein
MIQKTDQLSHELPPDIIREGTWAAPVASLHVDQVPAGLTAANAQGRQAIGALQGFGQLSPIYEFGFDFMGGAQRQEFIWIQVLTRLAKYFDIEGQVTISWECLDSRLFWSSAKRVWKNAGIRSTIYKLTSTIRWLIKLFKQ